MPVWARLGPATFNIHSSRRQANTSWFEVISSPLVEVAQTIAIIKSACLSVSLHLKNHVQTSQNFMYMLTVSVAQSSEGKAVRYVLLVLWIIGRLVTHCGGECTHLPPALCRHYTLFTSHLRAVDKHIHCCEG